MIRKVNVYKQLEKNILLKNYDTIDLFNYFKNEIINKLKENRAFIKFRNTYSIYYNLNNISNNELKVIEDLIIEYFKKYDIIINFNFEIDYFKKHNEIRYELIFDNKLKDNYNNFEIYIYENHKFDKIINKYLNIIDNKIKEEKIKTNNLNNWIKIEFSDLPKNDFLTINLVNEIIKYLEYNGYEAYCIPNDIIKIFFK